MPANGYTVGRDYQLDLIGPQGPLNFTQIISFSKKQERTDKKIKGLDGITRHIRFPDGWSGSLGIERQDSTIDDYFAQIEADFYAGMNELPITITETIQEVSGAISQYRYLRVLLSYDDAGEAKGDDSVHQKVSFVAARRIKIS